MFSWEITRRKWIEDNIRPLKQCFNENNMLINWKLESDVKDDYVKKQFNLGLKNLGLLMKNLL